jgi:hypothetical protein
MAARGRLFITPEAISFVDTRNDRRAIVTKIQRCESLLIVLVRKKAKTCFTNEDIATSPAFSRKKNDAVTMLRRVFAYVKYYD